MSDAGRLSREQLLRKAAREVFKELVVHEPPGWSQRYTAGWNDAIHAVTEKLHDLAEDERRES